MHCTGRWLLRVKGDQGTESQAALSHRDEKWRAVRDRRHLGKLERAVIRLVTRRSPQRTPAEFAACSAPGPQRSGALRYTTGSAPRPVAPPSPMGSNVTGTPLIAG